MVDEVSADNCNIQVYRYAIKMIIWSLLNKNHIIKYH